MSRGSSFGFDKPFYCRRRSDPLPGRMVGIQNGFKLTSKKLLSDSCAVLTPHAFSNSPKSDYIFTFSLSSISQFIAVFQSVIRSVYPQSTSTNPKKNDRPSFEHTNNEPWQRRQPRRRKWWKALCLQRAITAVYRSLRRSSRACNIINSLAIRCYLFCPIFLVCCAFFSCHSMLRVIFS